eukprot:6192837-Pyramimonas_sp.AAC.1
MCRRLKYSRSCAGPRLQRCRRWCILAKASRAVETRPETTHRGSSPWPRRGTLRRSRGSTARSSRPAPTPTRQ